MLQELLISEKAEDKNSDIYANIVGSAEFFIEKDPMMAKFINKSLCMNFVSRSIFIDGFKDNANQKLELLFMLSDLLAKEFQQIFVLHEQRKDTGDFYINALIQYYVHLNCRLPLHIGQMIIPFYCDTEEHTLKKKIWETLRLMWLFIYKYWKERPKIKTVLVTYGLMYWKMFGILQFLHSSLREINIEGHVLEDPEIRKHLMTPNDQYDESVELEALFLTQILASHENRDILCEIKLNNFISTKLSPGDDFSTFFQKAINLDNYHAPEWVVDYCESMLDLEYIESSKKIIIKGRKPTAKGMQ